MRTKLLPLVLSAGVALGLGGCSKRKAASEWPPAMRATPPESATTLVRDAKGDVVLLVLYASWCSGCREEIPAIDRLSLQYEGRGLRVVALALDEDPQDFAELLAEHRIHLDLVRVAPMDNARLVQAVRALGGKYSESIPYVALFDREGKLVREWLGEERPGEVEAAVAPLL